MVTVTEEIRDLLRLAADHEDAGDVTAAAEVLRWAVQQIGPAAPADPSGAGGPPFLAATLTWRLADALRQAGDLEEAHLLARHLVDDLTARHGPAHPAALRATGVLARIVHDQGQLDAADDLYAAIVYSGADDTGQAGWALRLARAHRAQLIADRGQPRRAAPLLADAIAGLRGPTRQHATTSVRLTLALAELHQRLGEPGNAVTVLDDAAHTAHHVLGADHPLTARIDTAIAALNTLTRPGTASATAPARPRRSATRAIAGAHRALSEAPSEAPPEVLPRAVPGARADRQPRRARRWRPRWTARWLFGGLSVLGVAAGGLNTLLLPDPEPPQQPAAPVTARPPTTQGPAATPAPQEVRVTRNPLTVLVVTWSDPTGTSPAVVQLTRGGTPVTTATVPAGTTEHRFSGLGRATTYCICVALVYGVNTVVGAPPVCAPARLSTQQPSTSAAAVPLGGSSSPPRP
ncbi:hypothetical protein ACFPIJ_47115 [Dactylosporangium cerinum]|uniref:Fibronectin type-III domain-containing protein n=1 Tax=Dactylosporangium cerinum TaxID=1434730 RepID=A0ABV9WC88_9ACTN